MRRLSCIIIEDEPPAQEKLTGFIRQVEFLDLRETFASAVNVPAFLSQTRIDLLFLDIQLGVLNGLDFLDGLRDSPVVIFTTAYAEFAIRGYRYHVADYLLKPYSFERFHQAVSKAATFFSSVPEPVPAYIFVKTEYRMEKILLSDILYVEGMKDYLKIVTTSGSIMTLLSFRRLQDALPAAQFARAHNSFLVALDKITSIEKDRIRVGNTVIPLGKTYRDPFLALINQRSV